MHTCEPPEKTFNNVHERDDRNASEQCGYAYGSAIEWCREYNGGEFIVGNDEYQTRVNFCPFCGAKAPKQVEIPEAQRTP